MKKILRLSIVALIVAVLFIAIVLPVHAISSTPTLLQINSVTPFQNCLQLGDMAFAVDYTITYAVLPTETITTTYNARLMNGATQIRSIAPFSFFNNGFSRGLVWIYFNVSDVALYGLVWGTTTYSMRLDGNPTATWTGAVPSASPISGASFLWTNSSTTVAQNQILATNFVLTEAQAFTAYWASPTNYTLYQTTAQNGTSLTTAGNTYFSSVIQDLALIAPNALATSNQPIQLITPTATPDKYANEIASDVQGTNYTTGTATFTQGSTTVTGIGTAWTTAMIGGLIKQESEYAYYVIQNVNAGTQTITLTSNYVPTGGVSIPYLIRYNATLGATTGAVPPLSLGAAADAIHVGQTVLGTLVCAGICVFVIMHGCGAANSYRPAVIICIPLLYLFVRIGWLNLAFVIGLSLFALFTIYYVFFYEKQLQ